MSLTMNRFQPPSLLAVLLALIFTMGAFSLTVFGSTGDDGNYLSNTGIIENDTLIVNAVWLDGEMIRIDVTDPQTDNRSSLAVPLSDYLKDGDNSEFLSIQAVDENGKQSGVIEIKNPFYNPHLNQSDENTDNQSSEDENSETDGTSDSAVPNPNDNANSDQRPLTPDGTGSVVDNVNDTDEKEFFTIYSEDGSQFYLIIDRQRNSENVYFLNAVTEEDLMSLAKQNGKELAGNGAGAIPAPEPPNDTTDENSQTSAGSGDSKPETDQDESPSATSRITSNLALMGGIVVVVGGIAYYLKVIKPRKYNNYSNDDDDAEDPYGIDDAMDEEIEDLENIDEGSDDDR